MDAQQIYFKLVNEQSEIRSLDRKQSDTEGDVKLAYSTIKAVHVSTLVGLNNALHTIMLSTIVAPEQNNTIGQ